jgi:hypothetical protein
MATAHEAISFPPSFSLVYSSTAVGVSYRPPLHAALLGSWITAGSCLLAFIFSTRSDQPPCAATLPPTHPLKIRIATLLHALHFMRDWQANPFCRGFRRLPFPFLAGCLVSWDLGSCPTPKGRARTGGGGTGASFQGP